MCKKVTTTQTTMLYENDLWPCKSCDPLFGVIVPPPTQCKLS